MIERGSGSGFFLDGGADSCLLVSGLSGAEQMRPLAEALHEAGFTVSVPGIRYTDETSNAVFSSNWRTWLDEAREAFTKLDRTRASVAVVGFGVGGALSMILAAEYPVSAVVAISPYLRTRDVLALYFSIYSRHRRTGEALFRLRDLTAIVRLSRRSLFAVVAPVLIVQPEDGEYVHPSGAKLVFSGVSSRDKRILWLSHSRHDFPSAGDREEVWDAIKNHLRHACAPNALVN
jgi:carboxylesterase